MKKSEWVIILFVIILIFAILAVKFVKEYTFTTPSHYSTLATVVSSKDGEVIVCDKSGNVWAYKGSAKPGQKLNITFATQGTETITDDAIIKVY